MPKQKVDSFQELKAHWYKKLEKSGFVDIEANEDYLKRYSPDKFKKHQNNGKGVDELLLNYESKKEYYRLAGQFLWDHKFENKTAELVWKFHSEGVTYRSIPDLLKKHRIKKSSAQVQRMIYKLEAAMLLFYSEPV